MFMYIYKHAHSIYMLYIYDLRNQGSRALSLYFYKHVGWRVWVVWVEAPIMCIVRECVGVWLQALLARVPSICWLVLFNSIVLLSMPVAAQPPPVSTNSWKSFLPLRHSDLPPTDLIWTFSALLWVTVALSCMEARLNSTNHFFLPCTMKSQVM